MSEHTPTPWKIYDDNDPLHVKIKGQYADIGGAHVADVLLPANAAFIVKAVNAHDALVAALEEIEDLGADGVTAARLGNIAHAALISLRAPVGGSEPSSEKER